MIKAISLLSGGLDSILATKLILSQGIDIEALNFLTVFCSCTSRGKTCLASKSAADQLGIKLKVFEVSKEYFEIVKTPKHGYGRNMNPCIDCRIFIFKKAAQYMKATGAKFIITGEVLGERPMSQRKEAIMLIERESGLEGLILRPLSAKLFKPSLPEKEGWVDREKLLEVKGRSRKPQIQLARDLGINDYPCPAGGCLLTDGGFANRMRDLIKHKPDFTINDVQLLKLGRHFRLNGDLKLIVGRNEKENNKLLSLAKEGDLHLYPAKAKGPSAIAKGLYDSETIKKASSIVARYSDKDTNASSLEIAHKILPSKEINVIMIKSADDKLLEEIRI